MILYCQQPITHVVSAFFNIYDNIIIYFFALLTIFLQFLIFLFCLIYFKYFCFAVSFMYYHAYILLYHSHTIYWGVKKTLEKNGSSCVCSGSTFQLFRYFSLPSIVVNHYSEIWHSCLMILSNEVVYLLLNLPYFWNKNDSHLLLCRLVTNSKLFNGTENIFIFI